MATGGDFDGFLPYNVTIEDLSKLKCQPCQGDGIEREAVGLCTDCQEFLCRKCFDVHIIPKPTRHHQLFNKQQILKSLQKKDMCTKKCSLHDEDVIKFYCIEHRQLGCSACLSLDHRTCEPVHYIPDVAINLDANADFKEAEQYLFKGLALSEKVCVAGARIVESIEINCAEAIERVETHRKHVNYALDKIQTAIIEKIEAMEDLAIDKISNITDKYRETQRKLQELQRRTEQLKRNHQECDLYTELMQMKDRMRVLEGELNDAEKQLSLQATHIQFIPNEDLLEMLKSQTLFGKVTEIEIGTPCIVEIEHVLDIDVKYAKENDTCAITGSAFLSDNILAIVDQSNRSIKAVDLQKARVIMLANCPSPPWDVCKINNCQVAVTCPVARQIALVNVGTELSLVRTINVDGECVGVDYKDGKLAVSIYSKPNKVQVLNLQGEVLHDITTDQQDQPLFNYPWHLHFDQNGKTLYVTNYWSDTVVRVRLDGTRMATYTNSELVRPVGITLDSEGNVYACCRDSCNIHQISPNCRKLNVLLSATDNLKYPYSISYRKTDDTFCVGSIGDNNIKIYKSSFVGVV